MLVWVFILSRKNQVLNRLLNSLRPRTEKLQRLNDSKNQLFSIVSHDLRSAVYTLQININQIQKLLSDARSEDAISLAEDTEQIIASTQSLLNNLLYWSLSEAGQINYNPQKVSMQAIIDQVCYDFLPIAESKELIFHIKITPELFCTIDVESIKLVLRNLLDNAIKYTQFKGIVFISAWETATRCYISVQDTGIGMTDEIVEAIRVNDHKRITQDTYGRRSTGIGLWLAKNMTERNDGTLTVSSVKGIGTTITISLPADRGENNNS